MKLEYNILWLDNDLQSYIDNGEVDSIKAFLIDYGFEPNIVTVFDECDLDKFISEHEYDLIISDFNLENTTGDLIIEDIRNNRNLDTEILFYTAQGSYKSNPEVKDRLAFIERLTFQVGRENLLDKIERVIALTLKKLLELNATRGLITAATSDLDVEISEIVMQLVEKRNIKEDILRGYVNQEMFKPLEKRVGTFWDKYNGFENCFQKMDAMRRWKIFRILLKQLNSHNGVSNFLNVNVSYQDDVIEIRNKFAHAKAEMVDGIQVLKGSLGNVDFNFDLDACVDIRNKLITHKNNFESLRGILQKI